MGTHVHVHDVCAPCMVHMYLVHGFSFDLSLESVFGRFVLVRWRFGVSLESVWGRFGISLGSVWELFGSVLDEFGTCLGCV